MTQHGLSRRLWLSWAGGLTACGRSPTPPELAGQFTGIETARGHLLRHPATLPAPSLQRRCQVLVLGGGVAGLAATRALRQQGCEDFALLELEDEAGGNSRAARMQGLDCPLGAHYLPVPGPAAPEVRQLLVELGLADWGPAGWRLTLQGERHLCHSPQERLFFQGRWQAGLLPTEDVGPRTLAQYHDFAQAVTRAQRLAPFAMPMAPQPPSPYQLALDAVDFASWLAREGLDDPYLRGYLDYCCRDDYGAGLDTVSAWAGLHYFASRHGFHAPHSDEAPAQRDQGVLTWPEGNAWLTRRLAAPLQQRLCAGRVVLGVHNARHGVEVDAYDTVLQRTERWQARSAVVALPLFVAARVVQNPVLPLAGAVAGLPYAPWLVANLHLSGPLHDRPGAPPSWDNVIWQPAPKPGSVTPGGLGYVDAGHQRLSPLPGPTVLTHYRALGTAPAARHTLFERPWSTWRDQILQDLALPHPDLAQRCTRLDITRYGHAMAVPVPGLLTRMTKLARTPVPVLASSLSQKKRLQALRDAAMTPCDGRLCYAHSDWSAYSVFEEAFTRGHVAGRLAAQLA